jgi:dienelactone hydrolase
MKVHVVALCIVASLFAAGLSWMVGELPSRAQALPTVTAYDLGAATVNDPALDGLEITVTLQGAIALPESDTPAPLVVVLHGRHAMCVAGTMSDYPCQPDEEVRYDLGFSYLAEGLAAAGYAVAVPNIKAGLTEAYGRGDVDARTAQIVDLHLDALRTAVAGQESELPAVLENRIDFSRLTLIGHSSGGGAALSYARGHADLPEAHDVDALLLVAAAYNALGPEGLQRSGDELYAYYSTPAHVPVATILPDCDGDQIRFWSQTA